MLKWNGLVAQWSSALAAMAMLSARTRVWVPPTTSGFFVCNYVSPFDNQTQSLHSCMCCQEREYNNKKNQNNLSSTIALRWSVIYKIFIYSDFDLLKAKSCSYRNEYDWLLACNCSIIYQHWLRVIQYDFSLDSLRSWLKHGLS